MSRISGNIQLFSALIGVILLGSCKTHEDIYSSLKPGMNIVLIDTAFTSFLGVYEIDSMGSQGVIKNAKHNFALCKIVVRKNNVVEINNLPLIQIVSKKILEVVDVVNDTLTYQLHTNMLGNETSLLLKFNSTAKRERYRGDLDMRVRVNGKDKYLIFSNDEIITTIIFKKK